MKNWKTTAYGLAASALNLFANGANWKQVFMSIAIAMLGLVAKDHDN